MCRSGGLGRWAIIMNHSRQRIAWNVLGYFTDMAQAKARATCTYMHSRTCTYASTHARTYISVFIRCCDGVVGWNGRESTTGLVMLIFFSLAHTRTVCVYVLCQWVPWCSPRVDAQAWICSHVFILFVCSGRWHCRNGDFIGLLSLIVQ